jgi:hypothetical protein
MRAKQRSRPDRGHLRGCPAVVEFCPRQDRWRKESVFRRVAPRLTDTGAYDGAEAVAGGVCGHPAGAATGEGEAARIRKVFAFARHAHSLDTSDVITSN